MQYKILASDLDKTLLNNDGYVSRENWAAIEKLYKMGVQFVPTTGRSFKEMPRQLQDSPFIRYYITSNGAAVYDKETGRSYDFGIRGELAKYVLDTIYQYPINLFFHTENNTFTEQSTHNAETYREFHLNDYWIPYALSMVTPKQELKQFAYRVPYYESLTAFFKNREDLLECMAEFAQNEQLFITQTDPWNVEVFSAQAGKGKSIHLLAELLGVPVEATIGVGDSLNDTTLIKDAGLGLAVSNALPEIKALADAVICSNEEHCVDYILRNYFSE